MFELIPGKADPNQKDENGKKLSKESLENMGKYRARCNKCLKNFCANCKEYPYHLGYTCDQFKFYKSSVKCRYCKQEIQYKKAQKPMDFIDICNKLECIKISKWACKKVLKCGHRCYGIFTWI